MLIFCNFRSNFRFLLVLIKFDPASAPENSCTYRVSVHFLWIWKLSHTNRYFHFVWLHTDECYMHICRRMCRNMPSDYLIHVYIYILVYTGQSILICCFRVFGIFRKALLLHCIEYLLLYIWHDKPLTFVYVNRLSKAHLRRHSTSTSIYLYVYILHRCVFGQLMFSCHVK